MLISLLAVHICLFRILQPCSLVLTDSLPHFATLAFGVVISSLAFSTLVLSMLPHFQSPQSGVAWPPNVFDALLSIKPTLQSWPCKRRKGKKLNT